MSDSQLRLECLRQATIFCCALKGQTPPPQSGDVLRMAQSYFDWITRPPGSARDGFAQHDGGGAPP